MTTEELLESNFHGLGRIDAVGVVLGLLALAGLLML